MGDVKSICTMSMYLTLVNHVRLYVQNGQYLDSGQRCYNCIKATLCVFLNNSGTNLNKDTESCKGGVCDTLRQIPY